MRARAREVTYEKHDLGDRVGARTRCHARGRANARERGSRVRRPAALRARRRRRGPAVRVLSPRIRRAAPLLPPAQAAALVRAARLPGASSLSARLGRRRVTNATEVGSREQREARMPPAFRLAPFYIATVRLSRDHFLPPDPTAFLAAEPATGRVIVIAPTRAACETIELAMGLAIDTLLEREHGEDIRRLAASGRGFGVVAGTGTGKTLAIRPIAETIVRVPLRVGVVNREREATPETPTWNVVIVTTGIARRWFEDGLITARDTLVVDEIHQTSAEMELCLALGKRAGCRCIWLSATVDPSFYARYLGSVEVLETRAFDPAKAARVSVLPQQPLQFLDDRFMKRVLRERRGGAGVCPPRAAGGARPEGGGSRAAGGAAALSPAGGRA